MQIEIDSFDNDEIDMMIEKMDIKNDNELGVGELGNLVRQLNLKNLKDEIDFVFRKFRSENDDGRVTSVRPGTAEGMDERPRPD